MLNQLQTSWFVKNIQYITYIISAQYSSYVIIILVLEQFFVQMGCCFLYPYLRGHAVWPGSLRLMGMLYKAPTLVKENLWQVNLITRILCNMQIQSHDHNIPPVHIRTSPSARPVHGAPKLHHSCSKFGTVCRSCFILKFRDLRLFPSSGKK